MADLARTLSSQPQCGARRLRRSTAAQCRLGAAVLRRQEYRRRFVRDRCLVAGHCVDGARIRGREGRRRVVGGALFDLGQRRQLAESVDLEIESMSRRFTSPHQALPRTHLLSNGEYSVMLTVAGSGYSRWRDIAVTRWREDPTCDPWGCYIYLRDVVDGEVWSAGYQPVGHEPDAYEALFFEDRAQITRRDGSILAVTEILVSPDDNAEVRRVSLTNQGKRTREIELTSYAEVVLAPAAADAAHPA